MENPGEHLVGQYLRQIKNCDFVEYNLQTKFVQGEIDVVGINSGKKIVYICEVAVHLGGLQYVKNNQPDNVNRFVEKFRKNIRYAEENFKDYEKVFMLWTPIIRIPKKKSAKHNQLKDIESIVAMIQNETGVIIEPIYNESFLKTIQELRQTASKTTEAMTSPIMRFLQIEETLKRMILR